MAEDHVDPVLDEHSNPSLLIPDVGLLGEQEEEALREAGRRWAESVPHPNSEDRDRADPFLREVVAGQRPGSKYARVRQSVDFRPVDRGVIRATLRATQPRTGPARFFTNLKNFVFGDPLAVSAFAHERLTKVKA